MCNRSKFRCSNCSVYDCYVAEFFKPLREKEQKMEENLTQSVEDDPVLLFLEHEIEENKMMLLNEDTGW